MFKFLLFPLLFALPVLTLHAQDNPKPTPQWRPDYHFTPPTNWTNDPNGLIFLNGEYHLYYQHNPFENKWGHMSWGHATSKDLVQWKNLPVAIPERISNDTVVSIFSGSAVIDKKNTSGFGKGKAPIVALYTGHLPNQKKQAQYVAYSNDNGLTFTEYDKNPVIDLNEADFRDPNVFWHEPTKQWILTVVLTNQFKAQFYGSPDLKNWKLLSEFGPQGFHQHGWECPFLVPMAVDGNAKNNKWVLMISSGGKRGPFMQYFIGNFDGKTFTNDHPKDSIFTVDYGDAFYAAIPWQHAPNGKHILIGWLQPGRIQTYPWTGQMSLPRDLAVKTTSEGIRLIQKPSSVVEKSFAKNSVITKKNLRLTDQELPLNEDGKFNKNAYCINATIAVNPEGIAGFKIAQSKDKEKSVTVAYDAQKQVLYVDCTLLSKDHKSVENLVQDAPMKPINGKINIQIFLDKSSLEVFGNNGEKVITTILYPGDGDNGIAAFAKNGSALIENIAIRDLHQE